MIANKTSIPLAAGENIYSEDAFKKIIDDGCVYVIQPDIAKWGGFSKTIKVARKIVSAGKRYCPHYLGGGIGLVASAHALAAIGGNGMLEVDINHNPLRSQLCGDLLNLSQGVASIGGGSGLGFTPDIGAVEIYRIQ